MSSNTIPTSEEYTINDESDLWPPKTGDRFTSEGHTYYVHSTYEGHGGGQRVHLTFETTCGRHDIYPPLSRVWRRVIVEQSWTYHPRNVPRGE